MAVHVPVTDEAQEEASRLMVTSKNMLNPSNGEPIVSPSQDMVLGCYYLTRKDEDTEARHVFANKEDATMAYDNGIITFHMPIKIRIEGVIIETTYGRVLFNEVVDPALGFVNETLNKKALKKLLSRSFDIKGGEETAFFADRIKNTGFKYATAS